LHISNRFPRNGRERARKAEKAGKPGFPRNGGGNGPGESGKAGVPSQWEGTGQEKAGRPGFPRNGRERARQGVCTLTILSKVEISLASVRKECSGASIGKKLQLPLPYLDCVWT
jgi:hypothetical protein